MEPQENCDLSIVVPVLNEEEAISVFLAAVAPILKSLDLEAYEVVFVDDGSTDRTIEAIEAAQQDYPFIKLVSLSRNFGKEAALTAGLEWSRGAAVVPMDVDLQDPPELLEEFVRLWREEGYEVVYGLRQDRSSDSSAKRNSAGIFYRVFNMMADRPIEPDAGDFRLITRQVVEATLQLRERNRFMKGIFSWVGYKRIAVPYTRPPRAAGETKFNYWKLWNFALDGITGFSTVPLKLWTYVGVFVAFLAFLYTVYLVGTTLMFGRDVPGYASTLAIVLFLGGVQLISLGVIGEYLGRLYLEVKGRPIYLVRGTMGFDTAQRRSSGPHPVARAVPKTDFDDEAV